MGCVKACICASMSLSLQRDAYVYGYYGYYGNVEIDEGISNVIFDRP